ncbi:MAG: protein translocase subunit SecD [Calditrichaeota bacterium]|nr:protein translocase subunit SecD [Calditrichota bacterium]
MKPKKLTPRAIIILVVLLISAYYLYPTLHYNQMRKHEEREAQWIALKMGVSYPFVIEGLYREDAMLLDRLHSATDIDPVTKSEIETRVHNLQTNLQEKMIKVRKKAIKQGLDLQGGMHLVLEVDVVQLMRNLARQRDTRLDGIFAQIEKELNAKPQLNFEEVVTSIFDAEQVKLSQYYGEPGESNATVIGYISKQADDAINRSLEILTNRIDQFGVSEPSIAKQGNRRLVLELPGVQDQSRARDLIGRTALLEFKLVAEPEKIQQTLQAIDKRLAGAAASAEAEARSDTAVAAGQDTAEVMDLTKTMAGDTETAKSDTSAVELETGATPFSGLLRGIRGDIAIPPENSRAVRSYLTDPRVLNIIPPGYQFLWSAQPELAGDGKQYYLLYLVKSESEITGASLADARVTIGGGGDNFGGAGKPIVNLTLNRQGARKFSRVTGANIDKRLSIVLDNKIYMAPVIRSKIPDGRAIIEGTADVEEANDLAIVLRAGALPTSVVIEEERTVGPSLGMDSIKKGLTSAFICAGLIIFFMILYYSLSGVIANVALLMNIVLVFAGLALFGATGLGATLTLPGIAGLALTVGMAVDANVLIFERIREELETGKTVYHSIAAGYERAFVTILDSNLTTLLTGIVLLQFGTGPLRGFAITLSIGLVANLFTAVFVTRLIFDWWTSRRTIARLSI